MHFRIFFALVFLLPAARGAAADSARLEALLVLVGDQHSAYEKYAAFLARIDGLRTENPGVPLAILIDGDAFEYGNALARRTGGALDFALFAALVERGPTILNLGNHEPDLFDPVETVARLRAAGVTVISANARDRATGRPLAPASTRLKLGAHEAMIVGLTTDRLATFRVAVRPMLDLADPVTWATQNFPSLLRNTPLPIVLSHAGLRADRAILPLVPPGTLFAGAHDHLRFVHHEETAGGRAGTGYFHSGSWLEFISLARLQRTSGGLHWEIEQVPLAPGALTEPKFAGLVQATLSKYLTADETAVVGKLPRALGPGDAAKFAVEAARTAAHADVALISGTTFGGGLPAGDVPRFAFDACVRFDGPLFAAEIDGARLKRILAHANQGPQTPFHERAGENLVAVAPAEIEADRQYRFVTTDWVAHNAKTYFGDDAPSLTELPGLKLKAAVLAALQKP